MKKYRKNSHFELVLSPIGFRGVRLCLSRYQGTSRACQGMCRDTKAGRGQVRYQILYWLLHLRWPALIIIPTPSLSSYNLPSTCLDIPTPALSSYNLPSTCLDIPTPALSCLQSALNDLPWHMPSGHVYLPWGQVMLIVRSHFPTENGLISTYG